MKKLIELWQDDKFIFIVLLIIFIGLPCVVVYKYYNPIEIVEVENSTDVERDDSVGNISISPVSSKPGMKINDFQRINTDGTLEIDLIN